MNGKWRRTFIIAAVLVATHLASAVYYFHRYARGVIRMPTRTMSLSDTPEQWAEAVTQADSTAYLQVAVNVSQGKGLVAPIPGSDPPKTKPFIFWGPGTPLVLGGWLSLVGGRTMFTFFAFAVAAQLFAGAIAVATAALWTRSTIALSLVALFSGFCPPLQDWFYGVHLTSSEIVSLPMLAILFYVLSRVLIAWTARQRTKHVDGISVPTESDRGWRRMRLALPSKKMCAWFAAVGILIGCASLSRDCVRVFGPFLAVCLVLRSVAIDRRRVAATIVIAGVLIAGELGVRYPVRFWNKLRAGRTTVCLSSEGCIWRYGIWVKHDAEAWFESVGLGFGEYLDPEAAARVSEYYHSGKPAGDLYATAQFFTTVFHQPIAALEFKTVRLPVLWLGTDMWPRSRWTLTSAWSAGMYATFAVFCLIQVLKRRTIPPVLYLYFLLVVAASPLIHFEFRYTFPIWNTLVMVPGLLYATLMPGRWREDILLDINTNSTTDRLSGALQIEETLGDARAA